ncbi:MAG: hypothetical protein AAF074_03370 [Pseudomonadota bacterium]
MQRALIAGLLVIVVVGVVFYSGVLDGEQGAEIGSATDSAVQEPANSGTPSASPGAATGTDQPAAQ